MANELGSILSSFGCFDDSEVPSLFDDLEALNNIDASEPNLGETTNPDDSEVPSLFDDLEALNNIDASEPNLGETTNPEVGLSSPDLDYDAEMMSIGSCSPHYQVSSPEPQPDHTYADSDNNNVKNNPVMTGAVSPAGYDSEERSPAPSPGGSLSSENEQTGNELLLYLMNETGVKIEEKNSEETETKSLHQSRSRTRSTTSTSSSKSRKRHLDDDDDGEVQMKNRKNAIAARENRLKKKKYIEGLETENKSLASENAKLLQENKGMSEQLTSLETEIDYLKSVLFNQSALSGLLKQLAPESQVRLSSSFQVRGKTTRKHQSRSSGSSGGVCLHVNGKDASLEFCAQCALMAEGASHQH